MLKDKILVMMSVVFMVFGLAIVEFAIMPAIIGLGLIGVFGITFIVALYNVGFLSDTILIFDDENIGETKAVVYEFPQYPYQRYGYSDSFSKKKIA